MKKIILVLVGIYLFIGLAIATHFALTYKPQQDSVPNNAEIFIINTLIWPFTF